MLGRIMKICHLSQQLFCDVMLFFFFPSLMLQYYSFDGELAFSILEELVHFGHRYYASHKREEAMERMKSHFMCPTWETQMFQEMEPVSGKTYNLRNHICRFQSEYTTRVLLGTHYDTRMWAEESDSDIDKNIPIVGANDGSSGVAVLAALSHLISISNLQIGVDLVLFDGEEFGRPNVGGYCKGSQYMALHIDELYPNKNYPISVVVLDMIGDKELQIRPERTSLKQHPEIYKQIWEIGKSVDASVFMAGDYGSISDDHSPFLELGIPSVLLIDFDYPYWHTQQDTLDKCSEKSLQIVGDVLWMWLNVLSMSS